MIYRTSCRDKAQFDTENCLKQAPVPPHHSHSRAQSVIPAQVGIYSSWPPANPLVASPELAAKLRTNVLNDNEKILIKHGPALTPTACHLYTRAKHEVRGSHEAF